MRTTALLALWATLLTPCLAYCDEKSETQSVPKADAKPAAKPGVQQAAALDTQIRVQLNYLLYLPKDYDKQEKWPLLLFLHGSGERGDDLELVKKHGPPKLIAAGKDFPFIVVSPQAPKGKGWESLELIALLDDLAKTYKVDQDRLYVTGLSMGGYGTFSLAAYAPKKLAAIAPICGGGEAFLAGRFAHLPVWVFHGALDRGVPLERSQVMVDALKKTGGHPKFTIYPDAGHDAWTETYDNPEFYTWLLEQKRSPAESEQRPGARWEKEIQQYETADKASPPPTGAVLFIGSSSIRLWKTLAEDFPDHKVINRGFGGSQISDSTLFVDRIVLPYKPRIVVLGAGGNDLKAGKTPEQVAADFADFVKAVHATLPETRIVFLSINPTPARWDQAELQKRTNQLIRDTVSGNPLLKYVDQWEPLLDKEGQPRPDLHVADRLHPNAEGYKIRTQLIAPALR